MDALILAGGENKRFPVTKGFLEINSKKILESNIKLLKGIFDRVIISTNNPELYFYLGVPMVGDVFKHRGPMTGILSALSIPEVSELFVTACDMPFIKPELIRYIINKYRTQSMFSPTHPSPSRGEGKGGGESLSSELWVIGSDQIWDAVIPIFDKKPQPLLGIYSKRIAQNIEQSIKNGERSLRRFLRRIDVLYIEEKDVRAIDPEGRSFVNINTMEDFQRETGGKICLV